MNKTLAMLMMFGTSCVMAFGQGAISFRNIGSGAGGTSVNARLFDFTGTTPLSGTGFSVQLWYGPSATPVGALTPLASPILGFNTGMATGYFGSPTVQIPGVPIGGVATLQVRLWDNAGGTITSYAQALTSGLYSGQSNAFQSAPLGDNLNPATIPVMQGLQTFFLIPEPSTHALLAFGLGALLLPRRRQDESSKQGRRGKTGREGWSGESNQPVC